MSTGKQSGNSMGNGHLLRLSAIMALCGAVYYLPNIMGMLGFSSLSNGTASLHNFYGIDLFGILFFAPVVYAAYVFGVVGSLLTAMVSMLVLLPYSILFDQFPTSLFKPTSFAIILSAVGAVVAMLQRSDEQRRQNVKEMKGLYDIGKAADDNQNAEDFLAAAVKIIQAAMPYPEATEVRITLRDQVFQSLGFEEGNEVSSEELAGGGDTLGTLEMYATRSSPYFRKQGQLMKTMAERISGAVREIELEQSVRGYYAQLEEMVEKRTHDLEMIQEKLIRSERLAAVGELASGVGHELRNPLNVIRNCVYLLHMTMAEAGDEEVKNTLGVLDKQIDISNRIVSDLLDFTRIKPPQRSNFLLDNLVKESLSWVTIPENVTVQAGLNGNSPAVTADAEQVGRVFANIITNAFQSMSNGSGRLTIKTGSDETTGWVDFEDNGCGIPEDNLERIFEPLFTTKPKGIGLGLAITRRLVDQNGGSIAVTSEAEKGTSFTIKLPLQQKERI